MSGYAFVSHPLLVSDQARPRLHEFDEVDEEEDEDADFEDRDRDDGDEDEADDDDA
jgi:hypothetical protein